MSEYKRPTDQQSYEENFEQIKPLMNATMAYYESSRCLFCYDAPCVTACPTGIDIPLFIRQINTGNIVGAAKTIYESNYFGNTCGKVCPTEVLCEGACVYNEQDVKPIEIGRLQNHASAKVIAENRAIFEMQESNGKKVAVIGAGPAGISCACELKTLGYEVDIFEAKSQPSGLALYGTAPYKITNQEVLDEMDYLIDQFKLTIKYDHPVKDAKAFRKLEADYDAIFLGVGLGGTRSINIPGEELEGCVGATELIEAIKLNPFETKIGKQVVVIGGGNTAMDAASESSRMGAEQVTLAYRRSHEEMSAYEFELDLAKSVGVQARFNAQPVEILGDDKVEAVRFIQTKTENGQLIQIPGSEFEIPCDQVIKATGQAKQTGLLDEIGISYDQGGRIEANYQCSNPKYFAAGDAVNGGAEVVNACAEAKVAAQQIDKFLSR